MASIRAQLTLWYAVALVATVLVFAATIYLVQRQQSIEELDSRLRLEADLIAGVLGEAFEARHQVVVTDTATDQPSLDPEVDDLLRSVPGFVVILLRGGDVLFVSQEARAVEVPTFSAFFEVVSRGDNRETFGTLKINPPFGQMRYFVRPVDDAGARVAGIVAGASMAGAELGPERLLSVMALIAPFIIAASAVVGYQLVNRTLKPVDMIVDEVEAITDGRSLHRRLLVYEPDEVGRLATTLNQMLTRLERSFLSLRRFTADASHELKTPLTVLRGGIERAITHPAAPPEQMEILEELLIEVNRMAEMVDSLLTLARADEGRAPLHLEHVDLREVFLEIAETANIVGEQAEVDVVVRVPPEPVPLRADASRVRQLLMNLLTNAVKYTPPKGQVWVESAVSDDDVVVTVRDTGIGIAPGDLPYVFDRFWRAEQARSRTGDRPGAGLGLAISKWIAEAHGGGIAVLSKPGRGTTFTVTLPRGENDAAV